MTSLLRAARATIVDNPLPARDAAVRMRSRPGLVAALGGVVVLVAATALAVFVHAQREAELIAWSSPEPAGRWIAVVVVIVALLVSGLGLPIAASVSLASERERGTLDLLRTTALTPGQLVTGKLVAAVLGAAPLLLAVPPLLAVGSLQGDVSPVHVLVLTGVVTLHAFATASVGVLAGAWAQRVRTATLPALLGAILLVGVPVTLPTIAMTIAWAAGESLGDALPGIVSSLTVAALVIAAGLVGARSALTPRALPRRIFRRPVLSSALFFAPLLVVASLATLPPSAEEELWANLLMGGWLFVWLLAVVVEMSAAGRSGDERSPLRAWVSVSGRSALALVGLGGVASVALVAGRPALSVGEVVPVVAATVLVFGLGLACAASLAGIVGLVVRGGWARVGLTVTLLAGIAFAPLFLGMVYWAVGGDHDVLPLISLNPFAQVGSVAYELDLLDLPWRARHAELGGTSVPTLVPGVMAYAGLLTLGTLVLVGARRGRALSSSTH
jgi:ABC-type transport system involved in multi-copper enzyme maturation permease subunit